MTTPRDQRAERPTDSTEIARDLGRRVYEPPRLEEVGRVATITMGSVGPFPESGGGFQSTLS